MCTFLPPKLLTIIVVLHFRIKCDHLMFANSLTAPQYWLSLHDLCIYMCITDARYVYLYILYTQEYMYQRRMMRRIHLSSNYNNYVNIHLFSKGSFRVAF